MHINALKTQLMHKNVQTNPEKSQKFTQHSCCSMLTREKNMKAIGGNGYHFVPKGGTFPTENHHAYCEKIRFVRSIYPNLPQMGQNLYHDMLLPLHDSMPSFMNFRRFLGRVGRTPLSPTLTWRWFQIPSRKGVLNRLFRTDAHQCL